MNKFPIQPYSGGNFSGILPATKPKPQPKRTPRVVGTQHAASVEPKRWDIADPDKECRIIARRLNDALKTQGKPAWYTPRRHRPRDLACERRQVNP